MTDDPSKNGDGSPTGGDPASKPAPEATRARSRAFGRRPDLAGAATVLSHNFRAPIVPGPPTRREESESGPAAEAAPVPGTGVAGPPVETPGPDTSEESDPRVAEPKAEAGEGPPPHEVDAEPVLPPEADPPLPAAAEPSGDTADVVPDAVGDAACDGADENAFDGQESGDDALDVTDDERDAEPMAGSLLAMMHGDAEPEDENEDGPAADENAGAATHKREIWFDGTDEPLGPPEEEESGQAPEDSLEPEPEPESPPLPPDEAELARRLGISFRDGEPGSADLERQRSREEAEIARKLGIRFRDGEAEEVSEADSDEKSEVARRLGISFRDPEDMLPVRKRASLTGRLIMLFTLFSGLAGLVMLLIFGESLFGALFG